jgi:uncharacterized protein YjiS (DUF1127 family)
MWSSLLCLEPKMSVNDVPFFETGRHAIVPRVLGMFAQLYARYLAYLQQRADITMLRSMSERELKDVGIYPSDIDRIANQARRGALDAALRARPGSTAL